MTKCGKLVRRICPNRQIAPIGPQPWTPFAIPLEERCLLPDYSASGARKSLGESCERMGLAAGGVHTLRMHDPDSIGGAFPLATSLSSSGGNDTSGASCALTAASVSAALTSSSCLPPRPTPVSFTSI